MNHYELCKLTAEWRSKKSKIVAYEYNNVAIKEQPDVIEFNNGMTQLYEIKTNKSDFIQDDKKICRIEKRIKYFPVLSKNKLKKLSGIDWKTYGMTEFITECPHLGRKRYFVCPAGLISPVEAGRWGLYWFKNNRFYLKKESSNFKSNIYDELRLLEHITRKAVHYGRMDSNIIIREYAR